MLKEGSVQVVAIEFGGCRLDEADIYSEPSGDDGLKLISRINVRWMCWWACLRGDYS